MRPKGPRDLYAGAEEGPVPPFPIKLSGPVIKGFGRGSREVGQTLSRSDFAHRTLVTIDEPVIGRTQDMGSP